MFGTGAHCCKYVFYNDGTDSDVFAVVKKKLESGNLNLQVFPDNGDSYAVNDVPLRDKADYGAEGGGKTYHF